MSDALRKAAEICGWVDCSGDPVPSLWPPSSFTRINLDSYTGDKPALDSLALQLWRKWFELDNATLDHLGMYWALRTDSLKAIELMVADMEVG